MKVSVLLPTYNQAAFLPAALAGLRAQTFRDFAIIACNDGSTDGTRSILANAGVWAVQNYANLGTAAAINRAAFHAPGEYMTWVSSDNVMEPDWLETLIGAFTPSAGAVYSAFWYEKPGEPARVLFDEYDPNKQINQEACYFGPSFLIRSEVWRKTGNHRGKISHDLDHWLRVEETCWEMGLQIVGVSKPLCHYSAHDQRVTITRRHEYDAPKWIAEAKQRRLLVSSSAQ